MTGIRRIRFQISILLKLCCLLAAVAALPPSEAAAQDYEAVERRLGEAVAAGEITLEQATLMMRVLLGTHAEGRPEPPDPPEFSIGEDDGTELDPYPGDLEDFQPAESTLEFSERLEEAVARGAMTEEEAQRQLEELMEARETEEYFRKISMLRSLGVPTETVKQVAANLREQEISMERLVKVIQLIYPIMEDRLINGLETEFGARHRDFLLDEVGLSQVQMEAVIQAAEQMIEAAQAN